MPYVVKCSQCLKQFSVFPKRYYSRKNFFCSKKCEGEYRKNNCKTKVIIMCKVCGKEIKLKKSEANRRNKNNEMTCSMKCFSERKKIKYMGRKNPNAKYNLDDNFFKKINTEGQAYVLGWIASDGSISKNGVICIEIKNIDREILKKIGDIVCKDIPVIDDKPENGDHSLIRFCSKTMVKDICRWLKIKPGRKCDKIKMPNLNKTLKWHFIRGFFDGDGSIRKKSIGRHIDCGITTSSYSMRNSIEKFCNIKCNNNDKWKYISWSGKNAMMFLDNLYFSANIFLERKHNRYLNWKN